MIKHIPGRIIVKADIEGKNWHTFTNGSKIRIERDYNNLDRKHTQQVLGEVVSGENIPEQAMVLFHHNSIHPVNLISNYSQLSGEEIASGVQYFSFREEECYAWKKYGEKEWKPTKGFALAWYIFKPYVGPLLGIEPKKIKDILYIASGPRHQGMACCVHKHSGMPIIFVNEKGIEQTIIRLRSSEDYSNREEIVAVDYEITDKINSGEYYVGVNEKDCKPLKEYYNE